MKIYKVLLYSVIMVLAWGCKREIPLDDLPLVAPVLAESNVQVKLSMLVRHSDTFELFYTEDGSTNFSSDKRITIQIAGKEHFQPVVFYLQDSIKLTNIRIDVGNNPEQEKMVLKDLEVKYYSNRMLISAKDFFNYFQNNDNLVINKEEASMSPVAAASHEYDPMFFPNPQLTEALKELTVIRKDTLTPKAGNH